MSVVSFAMNAVLVHSAESNFWSDRRDRVCRNSSGPGGPIQAAGLPATATPSDLFRQFPSLDRISRSPPISPSVAEGLPRGFVQKHAGLLNALPHDCGTVRKVTAPPGIAPSRIVIHIQDVHHNEEAQRNIGRAVQALVEKDQAGLVALEGAFEPITLSGFRAFSRQDILRKAADHLLRVHKISGPIHAALTGPKPFPAIIGIDDPAHHQANMDAYRRAASRVQEHKGKLASLQEGLDRRKSAVFNPALLAFDREAQSYRAGRTGLGNYLKALTRHAGQDAVPSAVKNFLQVLDMESALDFRRVEAERAALVENIIRRLDKGRVDALVQGSAAHRMGQARYADFYGFLRNLCRESGVDLDRFPAMDGYIRYVLSADGVDAERLLKDAAALEKAVFSRLAKTPDERRLTKETRGLSLAGKLIDFSLTPEEYLEHKTTAPSGSALGDLSPFEGFYREAHARDHAMADNLLRAMEANGTRTAVLVTGGYHSPGMAAKLARAGVTVISFTPRLEKVDVARGSAYLSVFSREKTPLEKLFQGQRLFLATSPADTTLIPPLASALGAVEAWKAGERGRRLEETVRGYLSAFVEKSPLDDRRKAEMRRRVGAFHFGVTLTARGDGKVAVRIAAGEPGNDDETEFTVTVDKDLNVLGDVESAERPSRTRRLSFLLRLPAQGIVALLLKVERLSAGWAELPLFYFLRALGNSNKVWLLNWLAHGKGGRTLPEVVERSALFTVIGPMTRLVREVAGFRLASIAANAGIHDAHNASGLATGNLRPRKNSRGPEEIEALKARLMGLLADEKLTMRQLADRVGWKRKDLESLISRNASLKGHPNLLKVRPPKSARKRGADLLSSVIRRPADFDWTAAAATGEAPLFEEDIYVGKTSQGKIRLTPWPGTKYLWPVLGHMGSGWEIWLTKGQVKDGRYVLDVKAVKGGVEDRQTFQAGWFMKPLAKSPDAKPGTPGEALRLDTELGWFAIAELIGKPAGFNFDRAAAAGVLPAPKGLRLGKTIESDNYGYKCRLFPYYLPAICLGFPDAGWDMTLQDGRPEGNTYVFHIGFTKEGEPPRSREVRVGPHELPLQYAGPDRKNAERRTALSIGIGSNIDRRIDRMIQSMSLSRLAEVMSKPEGFDFASAWRRNELPDLSGVSFMTRIRGRVYIPFPGKGSYELSIPGLSRPRWTGVVKEAAVVSGHYRFMATLTRSGHKYFKRAFQVGPLRTRLRRQGKGGEWEVFRIFPIAYKSWKKKDPRPKGGKSWDTGLRSVWQGGDSGGYNVISGDAGPEELVSAHSLMENLSQIRREIPERDRPIFDLLLDEELEGDISEQLAIPLRRVREVISAIRERLAALMEVTLPAPRIERAKRSPAGVKAERALLAAVETALAQEPHDLPPPLTAEQEQEAFHRYRRMLGNRALLEGEMTKRYEWWVVLLAKRGYFGRNGSPSLAKRPLRWNMKMFEDRLAAGRVGNFIAIGKFDPIRDVRYLFFSIWWILQAMDREFNNNRWQICIPMGIQEILAQQKRRARRGKGTPDDEKISVPKVVMSLDDARRRKTLRKRLRNIGPDVEETASTHEQWSFLEKLMADIPPLEREVVELYLMGERFENIARKLHRTSVGVKFMLKAAIKRMRSAFAMLERRAATLRKESWDPGLNPAVASARLAGIMGGMKDRFGLGALGAMRFCRWVLGPFLENILGLRGGEAFSLRGFLTVGDVPAATAALLTAVLGASPSLVTVVFLAAFLPARALFIRAHPAGFRGGAVAVTALGTAGFAVVHGVLHGPVSAGLAAVLGAHVLWNVCADLFRPAAVVRAEYVAMALGAARRNPAAAAEAIARLLGPPESLDVESLDGRVDARALDRFARVYLGGPLVPAALRSARARVAALSAADVAGDGRLARVVDGLGGGGEESVVFASDDPATLDRIRAYLRAHPRPGRRADDRPSPGVFAGGRLRHALLERLLPPGDVSVEVVASERCTSDLSGVRDGRLMAGRKPLESLLRLMDFLDRLRRFVGAQA